LPDNMLLTQEIHDGVCFVQLHLDPQRQGDPFSDLPRIQVLHGLPGAAPARETVPLQWKNADLLEAAIPVAGREAVLNTVDISGQQPVTLPPVCLPYSPEFAPDKPGRGETALEEIAATSGGKDRVEIPAMWNELPVKSRYVELASWLLVVAAILFLAEILERRTGWVSRLFGRKVATDLAATEIGDDLTPAAKPNLKRLFRKPSVPLASKKVAGANPPPPSTGVAPESAPPKQTGSTIDALQEARERAKRRSGN
jgi:hypothetical protein